MNSTHTPGPWLVAQSGYANSPAVVYVGDRAPAHNRAGFLDGVNWIATVRDDESPDHPQYAANARLIAAAPDLLVALREITERYQHYLNLPSAERTSQTLSDMDTLARAALAKAVQS